MNETNKHIPTATAGDAAHSAIRAAAGLIPVAGGPIGELIGWIVKPPLEKRRDEWMAGVEQRLRQLHDVRQFSLSQLQDDEEFLDTFLHATQVAMRTSNAEKLTALRNAILNTACHLSADELRRSVFLSLIDNFTPVHIQLIQLFGDPRSWNRSVGPCPSPLQLIEHAYPTAEWDISLCQHICTRLTEDGVVDHFVSMLSVPDDPSEVVCLTKLGRQLLAFISEPDIEGPSAK